MPIVPAKVSSSSSSGCMRKTQRSPYWESHGRNRSLQGAEIVASPKIRETVWFSVLREQGSNPNWGSSPSHPTKEML